MFQDVLQKDNSGNSARDKLKLDSKCENREKEMFARDIWEDLVIDWI